MAALDLLLPARPIRVEFPRPPQLEGDSEGVPDDLFERARLVDRILTINSTATSDFLAEFSTLQLEEYLAHLEAAAEPRGRSARWVRPERNRGICWSVPRE